MKPPSISPALSLFLLSFLTTVCASLTGRILRLLLRLFLDFDNLHRIRGKEKMLAKTNPITE